MKSSALIFIFHSLDPHTKQDRWCLPVSVAASKRCKCRYPITTLHRVTIQNYPKLHHSENLRSRTFRIFACLTLSGVSKYISEAPCHEGVLGSGRIAPFIIDLGTIWRWVVIFRPRPPYSQGKSPRYPLDRRMGGPHNRYGRSVKRKIPSLRRESNPDYPIVQPTTSRYTDWATAVHICEGNALDINCI
jgi:hypothetical protein